MSPRVFAHLERTLAELFPAAAGARITHRWGGPIGVPRDWHPPSCRCAAGVVWAGGYVGDGVAATNLAGRTIADLVTGRDTRADRAAVGRARPPRWEPEPLRVLGRERGGRRERARGRRGAAHRQRRRGSPRPSRASGCDRRGEARLVGWPRIEGADAVLHETARSDRPAPRAGSTRGASAS